MENLLWAMGVGAVGLFSLAAGVAFWEHRRALRRRPWSNTAVCEAPAAEAAQPAAHLDVDLATLEPPSPDQRRREATLDAAFGSMVNGPASTQPLPWLETRPIVQAGIAMAAERLPHPH